MAKDSPIAFIAQEIPKVWGTGMKYMTKYVFQMTKYILICLISQISHLVFQGDGL